jgi:HSP20 family molecular chaperone IbpA
MDNKDQEWINKHFTLQIPSIKIVCGPMGVIIKKSKGELIKEENYYIQEYPDKIEVFIEMPGAKKDTIEVYSTENILYVKAKLEKKLPYRGEDYEFKIKLPYEVIPEESKAKYENGILNVTLKRKAPPTKIKVE